jgi:tetratricopeptide (TPR) repeat protein
MGEKKYEAALSYYRNSLTLLSAEKYPLQKIEEINLIISELKALDENYKSAVATADKLFGLKNFEEAISTYTKALGYKPTEAYPQQKITEAQNQLATVKNRDENYVAAIANGDRLFLESKLNEALDAYRQALALKPAEKYPREKSDEINKILLRQKTESDQYALALASGDKALGAGNFSLALKSYQEALVIKPNEKELLGKIDDVKLALAAKQNADEQYLTTLNTGDKLFAGKEYERAIIAYTDAVNSKPAEKYPQDQIVKINKIIGDLRSADDSYARAVSEGDLQFDNQKYTEAIASYKKASSFKPSETYPKTQLDKLNVLIAEQKKTESDYTALLASADKFLAVKKFDEAIADYRKALAIKPSEKYPADKVAETEKLLADLKSQQEAYDKAVADADKYLLDKDFVKALASYKEAGATKPSEAYPKQKITEVQAILDKDKAEGQRYQEAIAQADKFFADKKYLEALEPYQRALGIRPAEKYPQDQIASINKKIDELKKLDEDYLKLIAEANTELKAGKYEEARGLFTNAATLKPAEKLPMDKIVEIDGILSDLKNKEESFAKHISEGDAFFAGNQYNEAIASYNSALKIKPGETYPQSRIDKINVVLAGQKKLDSDYLATVTSADQFLSAKQYDEAIADYRKALTLKPSETYPSEKIAETEKLLADLKALQEAYDKAVANADKFLLDKDFAKALTSYKEANVTRPDEAYPKQKITEVQAILDKDKAEAQLYQEAIAQADKLFADHKYQEAKDPYLRASGIKPGEKYPQDQIAGINKLLDEQKKLDDDYQSAITEAEIQLKGGKYDNALKLFVTATTLKPTEKLPKDKIAEIDGILAEIQNKEQSYSKAVSEADASFAAKNFTEALASYSKASKIKPAETYPPAQMEKINTLLAAQKKLDDDYLTQLASADQLFDSQKYTEAIAGYRKALAVKPSEKYPSEKIAEAEKQIADQKALQQTYDKAVAEGTKKLSEKDYANALKAFQTANTAKPSETLPPQKIGEIQAIQDKIKAENERYLEAIALADKFYASEKYREAIEPYQSATTIKPTEKYPQDQVVKINQLLAEQKKTDDDYQKLITDADTRMTTGKYEEARGLYTTAGTLKPLEKLPKDKIAEIETILAGLKLKDENYTKALDRAAGLYADKNLKGALNAFEEALTIKPAEKYPQEQIATIKAAIKAIDDSYNKAIALGDEKLASKNLMDALNAYQNASEIKPGEEYPKTKIAGINSALIAQKEEMAKMYASYLAEGDRLSAAKDYGSAKSAFTKATGIKPEETYPKQRLAEINKIVEEAELAHRAEYNKALGEADKLYNSKIFDQAIDAYEAAALISPDEAYPALQISKIRKYMADHSIQDLFSQTAVISEGNEKKFTFSSIEPRLRKNNYILLKARSTGKTAPKVYLNYGKDNQKNGGIVLRSLDKTTIGDYIIRISVQDKWYREDNNWISLFVETGDIEITKVQIAAGDD